MRLRDSRGVVTLLATAGGVNVAYTALIPLVPHVRTELGASLAVIGLSFTAFALAKAGAQFLGGYLVERLTARAVAVGALGVASVAIAGVAFSRTGTDLLLWRVLWGASEGVLTPALYRLAVLIAGERGISQSRLMGWFASAAVGGMAGGPAVVGIADTFLGFRGIFLLTAGATVANAALVASCLRVEEGTAAAKKAEDASEESRGKRLALRSILVPVAVLACIDLVNNGLYAALEPLLPLTIGTKLGGGVADISILFSWGLVVFAVVSALGGGLVERVQPLSASGPAFLAMAMCLVVIAGSDDYLSLAIAFTAFMALQPMLYVITRRGLSEVCAGQARAFGLFGGVSDLGFVIGPAVGTLLLSRLGSSAYLALAAVALCAGMACILIGRLTPAVCGRQASGSPEQGLGEAPVGAEPAA